MNTDNNTNDIDLQNALWNSIKDNNSKNFGINDYRANQRNKFNSPQPNSRASCSLLKRSLQVGVGLTTIALTGYAIYTNASLIQRYVSSFQFDLSKLTSHINKLDFIKEKISQLPLKSYLKPTVMIAGVLFLLKLNLHKHTASAIQSIVKFVFNHKRVLLAAALITTILLYAPQSMISIYLIKTLGFLGNTLSQLINNSKTVAPAANTIDFLSKNAKLIGFLIFDFALLGFIHQVYDYCFKKNSPRFTGGSHRLGSY